MPAYCDEFKLLHIFGRIGIRAKNERKIGGKAKCQRRRKTKGVTLDSASPFFPNILHRTKFYISLRVSPLFAVHPLSFFVAIRHA